MTKKKITKKMTFAELLEAKPEAGEILMNAGMHCIGCPMSQMESIEEGCKGHGFSDKEVEELMEKISKEKTEAKEDSFVNEVEDMIYGFENYDELRPNKKRINQLKKRWKELE